MGHGKPRFLLNSYYHLLKLMDYSIFYQINIINNDSLDHWDSFHYSYHHYKCLKFYIISSKFFTRKTKQFTFLQNNLIILIPVRSNSPAKLFKYSQSSIQHAYLRNWRTFDKILPKKSVIFLDISPLRLQAHVATTWGQGITLRRRQS